MPRIATADRVDRDTLVEFQCSSSPARTPTPGSSAKRLQPPDLRDWLEHRDASYVLRLGTHPDPDRLAARSRALAAGPAVSPRPQQDPYYVCYGPRRSRLLDLAWIAGSRSHVEECFQQAKNEAV